MFAPFFPFRLLKMALLPLFRTSSLCIGQYRYHVINQCEWFIQYAINWSAITAFYWNEDTWFIHISSHIQNETYSLSVAVLPSQIALKCMNVSISVHCAAACSVLRIGDGLLLLELPIMKMMGVFRCLQQIHFLRPLMFSFVSCLQMRCPQRICSASWIVILR